MFVHVQAVSAYDGQPGVFEAFLSLVIRPMLLPQAMLRPVELGDEGRFRVKEVGDPEEPPVEVEDRYVHKWSGSRATVM